MDASLALADLCREDSAPAAPTAVISERACKGQAADGIVSVTDLLPGSQEDIAWHTTSFTCFHLKTPASPAACAPAVEQLLTYTLPYSGRLPGAAVASASR